MNVNELFNLSDKTAIVTGGGGTYGQIISHALLEMGAKVIITSTNIEKLDKFCEGLVDEGYQPFPYELDLASTNSIDLFIERVMDDFKTIDVLVNNAVSRPMTDYNDVVDNWEHSMKVNATGLFYLTRKVIEKMIPMRKGSIINISSIQGMVGPDFSLYDGLDFNAPTPDYFFHKAGMINLTRYFSNRVGRYNIRVNSISPGGIFNDQDPEFIKRYNEKTALGRMACGDDIKGAIVFLASDASSYVTGTNIVIDGGYTSF
jgi:NAD(P)-dependent dehydrogenase (short-subunit alcohol dehydrogenase family)